MVSRSPRRKGGVSRLGGMCLASFGVGKEVQAPFACIETGGGNSAAKALMQKKFERNQKNERFCKKKSHDEKPSAARGLCVFSCCTSGKNFL